VFVVLAPVVALERGVNPISRCFKLFHGNLGTSIARVATIFGVFIGIVIVAAIFTVPVNLAVSPATASTGALVVAGLLTTIIAVVIGAVAGVLAGPLTVTAYADMRARIEPVSTPQLAQELAQP
jgi:glycerol uptake facilitator-like aquaporin